jgi:hypothetical protein
MRMGEEHSRPPTTGTLHPVVYLTILALAVWFVLSAWGGFGENRQIDYLLVVVSGLVFVATAIPCILWRMASKRTAKPSDRSEDDASAGSFRDWAAHDFETWQDRVRGADAAIEILSPICAVAFGMMGLAIVLHLSVQHGL